MDSLDWPATVAAREESRRQGLHRRSGSDSPGPAYGGPAFVAQGWAYSRLDGTGADRIALVNARGIVLGFALPNGPRQDIRYMVPVVRDMFVGFQGYIGRIPRGTAKVSAIALLDNGRVACHLENVFPVNESDALPLVQTLGRL